MCLFSLRLHQVPSFLIVFPHYRRMLAILYYCSILAPISHIFRYQGKNRISVVWLHLFQKLLLLHQWRKNSLYQQLCVSCMAMMNNQHIDQFLNGKAIFLPGFPMDDYSGFHIVLLLFLSSLLGAKKLAWISLHSISSAGDDECGPSVSSSRTNALCNGVNGVEDPRAGLQDILAMVVAVPVSLQDFDGELTCNFNGMTNRYSRFE